MSDGSHSTNRLAGETSPYLLLHRHNPVDWMPWGAEALARARVEDKPIFLSVGYSTCYWCHVMERESFSESAIAGLMNEHFVNIKIDREERPELDEIYMSATQIFTGQGGWPNSVFLTPGLKPFFAGTYFPPTDRPGMPGFTTVLRSLAEAWLTRRSEVEEQALSLADGMRRYLETELPQGPAEVEEVERQALEALENGFDHLNGGFGAAPKFPTAANLYFLLEASSAKAGETAVRVAKMLDQTLDAMARGGVYDQLGGGFHRYSTDAEWKVPHFEKMLYDNGLLLEVYALDYARTGNEARRRVIVGTADFLARQLTGSEGSFWSALDAETDGAEGAYYVWTREELAWALGEEDFGFLAPLYGFDGAPLFEGSRYVLHRPLSWADQALRRRRPEEKLRAEVEPLRLRLLAARQQRKAVATDDKVLTDWNGATIRGLAVAGRWLDEPGLVEQAARAARHVLEVMRTPGRPLQHVWRQGMAKVDGLLGDYVFLVRGLLGLYEATEDGAWLKRALELTEEQLDRLGDPEGGFFFAAASADVLLRSRDVFDGALPSTQAVALLNLLDLATHTADVRWAETAARGLRRLAPLAARAPSGMKTLAMGLRRFSSRYGELDEAVLSDSEASRGECLATDFCWLDVEGHFELAVRLGAGWHVSEDAEPLALQAAGAELVELELQKPELRAAELRAAELRAPELQEPGRNLSFRAAGSFLFRGRLDRVEAGATLSLMYQLCDTNRCWPRSEKRLALPPLEAGPA